METDSETASPSLPRPARESGEPLPRPSLPKLPSGDLPRATGKRQRRRRKRIRGQHKTEVLAEPFDVTTWRCSAILSTPWSEIRSRRYLRDQCRRPSSQGLLATTIDDVKRAVSTELHETSTSPSGYPAHAEKKKWDASSPLRITPPSARGPTLSIRMRCGPRR